MGILKKTKLEKGLYFVISLYSMLLTSTAGDSKYVLRRRQHKILSGPSGSDLTAFLVILPLSSGLVFCEPARGRAGGRKGVPF